MSKARRPRHQRHGGKPVPARPPAAPEVIVAPPSTGPMPEPTAPEPPDAPATLATEVAPSEMAPAEALPAPLTALARDAGVPETAPVAILPIPAPTLAPALASALAPVTMRLSAESFGTTIMNYFIGEGEAMGAHWRALSGARSMAEIVRLQIGEFQRAADATLTCWGMLTLAAGRTVAPR